MTTPTKIETIDVGEVDWNATAVQYIELNKQKTEAIQRVRELHYEYPDTGDCAGCNHIYPCPTIQALDGEQE